MGRKKKKSINLDKIVLSEEEKIGAKKKALLTIILSFLWPITLILLWTEARQVINPFLYYLIVFISGINIILTINYSKIEIDKYKYMAYLKNNKIGKVEKFSSAIAIAETIFIIGMIIITR
ncbi:MAG: hypothetical protein ACTHWZ_05080 [Peptoniphilaceae bacterium]